MPGGDVEGAADLEAGDFSSWLAELGAAIRGERDSVVPCGGCTACCTASQFVHIGPDEIDTLAAVPRRLLFPAPGLAEGHVVMGYDERGRCPMLVDDRCSIYEVRPRTCRTYDCRVFAAAGVVADGEDGTKVAIARRVRRWRFDHPTGDDDARQAAVRAAASLLVAEPSVLGEGAPRLSATALAVLAVEIRDVFLRVDEETGTIEVAAPEPHEVRAAVTRRRSESATGRRPARMGRREGNDRGERR